MIQVLSGSEIAAAIPDSLFYWPIPDDGDVDDMVNDSLQRDYPGG